jgi:hypothetical protein
MNARPVALLTGLFLGLIVSFQNCGVANQIGFENGDASRLTSPDGNGGPGGGGDNSGGDGDGGPGDNPGDGSVDPVEDPLSDANFDCDRYVILTHQSPNLLEIPARDQGRVCYAVKLVSATNQVIKEGSTKIRDLDLRAAKHGDKPDLAPYLIASFSGEFMARGRRNLSLSKLPTKGTAFGVDNFVVLEAHYEASSGLASRYYAAGTSDSLLPTNASVSKPHLMIRNRITQELEPFTDFVSFAEGSTAQVQTGELSGFISPEKKVTLRLRALDCGHGVKVEDVYAIFR